MADPKIATGNGSVKLYADATLPREKLIYIECNVWIFEMKHITFCSHGMRVLFAQLIILLCLGMCPPGFAYLPSAAKCYQVVYEGHDWYSAGRRCQGLRSGSHLAAITSANENVALKMFLASELSRNAGNNVCDLPGFGKLFWTSGQQQIKRNCQSPFVWRIQGVNEVPFGFSSWAAGEPNCGNVEMCMHFWVARNFGWNDGSCTDKICPLCEYKP